MSFSSNTFLLIFLPLSLILYNIIPRKFKTAQNTVLLLASLFFCYYGGFEGFAVMLASAVSNYIIGILIDRAGEKKLARRICLIIGVLLNVALLGYFKYSAFAVRNINSLFGASIAIPDLLMPVGISFFTFQNISYIADVYKGTLRAERNVLNILTYITFFPKFISGPIVRYGVIKDGITSHRTTLEGFTYGLRRTVVGLAKKMIIADSLSKLSGEIFGYNTTELSVSVAWIGAVAYTLCIYYDFSGYSDMAIGISAMFGYKMPENFNFPYISKSISEFWRRWHISLGSWFRDYVYIPLGGNRCTKARQIFNICVVWALTGLWHGASWNIVLWGLYFAVILTIEKLFLNKLLNRIPSAFSHIYALFFIIIGWVIFNSASLHGAFGYIGAMFGLGERAAVTAGSSAVYYLLEYKFELIAAVIFSAPVAKALDGRFGENQLFCLVRNLGTAALFVISFMYIISSSFTPFIYLRF